MSKSIKSMLQGNKRDFTLFLIAGIFLGVTQAVDGSTVTNYLKEHFGMMILQRSALELPREIPGLIVVFTIGALSFLKGDVRISVAANLLAAVGMFLLGIIPPQYAMAVFAIFIYSMGQHIFMPLNGTIGMSFARPGEMGKMLGKLSSVGNMAVVFSSAAMWALYKYFHISFSTAFMIGAAAFIIAAVLLAFIKPTQTVHINRRFVFRREYGLYYWLCMLYGARKQIFITFGPWVLVEVFRQPVSIMSLLFLIIAVIGIFVKPWVGHMIDKVGEKTVLSTEAFLFFLTCLGYAFSESLFRPALALMAIYVCYILDITLDSVYMARVTYMQKIALRPEDVSPSLSLGTSIDHLVTIFLPILGGILWTRGGAGGYKYVFLAGAVVALLNFFSSLRIKIPKRQA